MKEYAEIVADLIAVLCNRIERTERERDEARSIINDIGTVCTDPLPKDEERIAFIRGRIGLPVSRSAVHD